MSDATHTTRSAPVKAMTPALWLAFSRRSGLPLRECRRQVAEQVPALLAKLACRVDELKAIDRAMRSQGKSA